VRLAGLLIRFHRGLTTAKYPIFNMLQEEKRALGSIAGNVLSGIQKEAESISTRISTARVLAYFADTQVVNPVKSCSSGDAPWRVLTD
jgi:hypothetical protein